MLFGNFARSHLSSTCLTAATRLKPVSNGPLRHLAATFSRRSLTSEARDSPYRQSHPDWTPRVAGDLAVVSSLCVCWERRRPDRVNSVVCAVATRSSTIVGLVRVTARRQGE